MNLKDYVNYFLKMGLCAPLNTHFCFLSVPKSKWLYWYTFSLLLLLTSGPGLKFCPLQWSFSSSCHDTESKEAASAVVDGDTKPASPSSSSSPPVHCSPPAMEPRTSNAGPPVDNPQLNSHPVHASSAPSEGLPHSSRSSMYFCAPAYISITSIRWLMISQE